MKPKIDLTKMGPTRARYFAHADILGKRVWATGTSPKRATAALRQWMRVAIPAMKALAGAVLLALAACAASEPAAPQSCSDCFDTCGGRPSDVSARHCVEDCMVTCRHADGGRE
jgi:hypothetical protein